MVASLAIFVIFLSSSVMGQVPVSPPGFRHFVGSWFDSQNYVHYFPTISGVGMGKDKYTSIPIAESYGSGGGLLVLDSTGALAFMRQPMNNAYINQFSAITNAHEIWYAQVGGTDSYVTIFNRQGAVLNQFMMPGTRIDAMYADTLGKVFMFVGMSPTSFGMIRFSNASTVDFAKQYPVGAFNTSIEYGGDGRFYVPTGMGMLSLDRDGMPLRFQSHSWGISGNGVYKDHGHAHARMVGTRTVEIWRTDSTMAVQWARRYTLAPSLTYPDSTLESMRYVVAPHSEEVLVTAVVNSRTYYQTTACYGNYDQRFLRSYVIRGDGTPTSAGITGASNNKLIGLYSLNLSPWGTPLMTGYEQTCVQIAYGPTLLWFRHIGLGISARECANYPLQGLTVTNITVPNGSSSSASGLVPTNFTVTMSPVSFAFAPLSVMPLGALGCFRPCAGITGVTQLGGGQVQFQDSVYGYHSVQYLYGDGNLGTSTDPLHTYPGPGNYVCTLIATNECGSDTTTLMVDPCRSAAMVPAPYGCIGLPVTMTQATTYPGDSIEWLVNGISHGTGNTMTFTPTAGGSYQVGIILHDAPCLDTSYQAVMVATTPPIAAFSYSYGMNNTVYFTNQSVNANAYGWTFGDGGTSGIANPSHAYAGAGSYTICMTATNSCGSTTACDTINCIFPQAGFTVSVSGSIVSLQDQSMNATGLSWNFGDGTTATGAVTSHTYANSGNYTICQYVSGACGVDTFCVNVAAITSNQYYFQTSYPAVGSAMARGQATNAQGMTCVVGTDQVGQFVQLVDGTGATQALRHLPSSSHGLYDVCTTPTGDFLVVGSHTPTGLSQSNGFWMLLSAGGTILSEGAIDAPDAEWFVDVKPARHGGYLLSGRKSMGMVYGFGTYAKLNANLQVEWSRVSLEPAYGGFQMADSSYWMVQWHNARWHFVHLSPGGVAVDEYEMVGSSNTWIGFTAPDEAHAVMDCNGVIYFTAPLQEDYLSNGGLVFSQAVGSFNTSTHAGACRTISHRNWGPSYSQPGYDFFPSDLILKPNGELLSVGTFHPKGNPNGPNRRDQFVTTFSSNLVATDLLIGNSTRQDRFECVSILPSGAYLVAGSRDDTLTLTKMYSQYCATPSSSNLVSWTPWINTNCYQGTLYGNQAYGSAVPTLSALSSEQGNARLLCGLPCSAGAVQAGFTVSQNGNTVTLTSTSTPGASLFWGVPGGGCAWPGSQVSFQVGCGDMPLLLTAGNGCVSDTFSMVLHGQGSMSTPNLMPNLLQDTALCQAGVVSVTAPSGYQSYLWSDGSTGTAINSSVPSRPWLLAMGQDGCYVTDTAELALASVPAPNLGTDAGLCQGNVVNLDAGAGYAGYLWSNGLTTQTLAVTSPGTYVVTVTSSQGCTGTDTIVLSGLAAAVVNLGADTTICTGSTVGLDAGPGYAGYSWSNGASSQGTVAGMAGSYVVTVTGTNGCLGTDTIVVSMFPPVVVNLGPDQGICPGGSFQLDAGPGFAGYSWSNGASSPSIVASVAGNYVVTVVDANGCVGSDSLLVWLHVVPSLLLSNDTILCPGDSAQLVAGGGFSNYLWSNGDTSNTLVAGLAGSYGVTATDANGCTASGSVLVTNYPIQVLNLGADTAVASGSLVQLNAGPGYVQYQWSNGWQGQHILATTVGTYWVQVIDSNGCMQVDTIVISLLNGTSGNVAGPFISVYPVPAQDQVNVDLRWAAAETVEIEVIDLNGKRLWEGTLSCDPMGSAVIDVRDLSAGYYWLRFKGFSGVASRRFGVVR